MATKKQRRRREKLHRHEYEYVVETDEGDEIVVTPAPKQTASPSRAAGQLVDGRGRVIQPPSWRRALKRAAIFGPLMVIFIFFIGSDSVSTPAKVINALVLVGFFIPFTYFVDRLIYKQVLKRNQRSGAGK